MFIPGGRSPRKVEPFVGLPEVARAILDDDRSALGMDREAYLLPLLFQRSLAVREEGPGFDGPRFRKKGR